MSERRRSRKRVFSLERSRGMVILDQTHSVSLATSVKMYSPGAMPYCHSLKPEVGNVDENDVLDLSVRTHEEPDGYYRDQPYLNGVHSPEMKLNLSESNGCHQLNLSESNGCHLSPTMLPLHPGMPRNGLHSPEIGLNHNIETVGCHFSPPLQPLPTGPGTRNGKPTRPFKAYSKNFLGLGTADGIVDDTEMRFLEFRRQCLSQLHANGKTSGNKNMKRPVQSMRPVQSISPTQLPSSSGDAKDPAYRERRRKNNEAAKRSRDARRAKEDEIAIRAAFLERENIQLRLELSSLKVEVERLRCILYGKN